MSFNEATIKALDFAIVIEFISIPVLFNNNLDISTFPFFKATAKAVSPLLFLELIVLAVILELTVV